LVYTLSPTFELVFDKWGFVFQKTFFTFVEQKTKTMKEGIDDIFFVVGAVFCLTVIILKVVVTVANAFLL